MCLFKFFPFVPFIILSFRNATLIFYTYYCTFYTPPDLKNPQTKLKTQEGSVGTLGDAFMTQSAAEGELSNTVWPCIHLAIFVNLHLWTLEFVELFANGSLTGRDRQLESKKQNKCGIKHLRIPNNPLKKFFFRIMLSAMPHHCLLFQHKPIGHFIRSTLLVVGQDCLNSS